MAGIGSLNEKPLHADLKQWYRRPGDQVEVPVDEFVVDLVRGDLLIEIQARGFSAMRRKLDRLLDLHPIRLVHPVPEVMWIVKSGPEPSRRRSPKRGIAADVCAELVAFPSLLSHPNLTVDVLLVEAEEVRVPDARRRRGYRVRERRLVGVASSTAIEAPGDLLGLVPHDLPDPFTTADLADRLGRTRNAAGRVAFCLRVSGAVETVGRTRAGYLYRIPAA